MFDVTKEALVAMTEAARPGRPLGAIDDAHRRVYDAAGFGHVRMAACGYSLGATYRPSWMDVPPMLYSGNETPAEPGMVLFMHAILADADAMLAMSLGHTVVVTDTGAEVLSRHPLDHVVRT
jgi:Xaa-Pro dipeptidase